RKLAAAVISGVLVMSIASGEGARDGKVAFEKRCTGCHAIDRDKVGPKLNGVFGRKAGASRAYTYSDALKAANLTSDAKTLERWLGDPDSVVPGKDMSFRLEDGAERAAIVEYLRKAAP